MEEAEHRSEKDMPEEIASLNNNILSRIGVESQQLTNGVSMISPNMHSKLWAISCIEFVCEIVNR